MSRVIIDVRGPAGEVGQFWVFEKVYASDRMLCAKVPCMVDFKSVSSHGLLIRNWANPDDAATTNPTFRAEAHVYVDNDDVTIFVMNAGNVRFGVTPAQGKASFMQFVASPEEAARFLVEEPPVATAAAADSSASP